MLTAFARNLVLTAGIVGCLTAISGPATTAHAQPTWETWVEAGGTVSNRNDRAEIVGFAPLFQNGTELLFFEARGKLFQGGTEEGNFALGYREMLDSGWNVGVWGGYDVRTSENSNTFHQIAGGIEALSKDWDVRLNGYYPLEERESVGVPSSTVTVAVVPTGPTISLVGSQLFFARGGTTTTTTTTTPGGFDLAAWGVDGEVGRRVPVEEWLSWIKPINEDGDLFNHEARIFLGAFYFDNTLFPEPIWGPRLRSEWRLNDVIESLPGSRLTLETEAQYDDVREDQFEIGFRLRIPLAAPSGYTQALSAQSARMIEALERDTDIVTADSEPVTTVNVTSVELPTTLEPVRDAATNVDLDQVVFIDAPGTAQALITAAGENSLIVLQGEEGDFGETVLSANQSVVGGTQGILLEGRTTSVQDTYVAPGSAATLHLEAEADILTVADSTHVTGLTISSNDDNGTDGINVPGTATNVFIDNNLLRNLEGNGLEVEAGAQVTFTANTVIDIGRDGATLGAGSTAILTNNIWRNVAVNTLEARENVTLTYTGNDLQGVSATLGPTPALFQFNGGAGAVTVLDGTGNLNSLTNAPTVCLTPGAASFTGTIDFGGVALTDNVLPCN